MNQEPSNLGNNIVQCYDVKGISAVFSDQSRAISEAPIAAAISALEISKNSSDP